MSPEKTDIGENSMSVIFASEEAGYLAGYCSVKEGMRVMGFMGGSRNPVIMDYGYGFLQGVDRAAGENGVSVTVDYSYSSGDEPREKILEKASELYDSGEEVIFACGKNVERPVIEAAELTGKKVIAYETDKSMMSDTIMTSAVKDMKTAIKTPWSCTEPTGSREERRCITMRPTTAYGSKWRTADSKISTNHSMNRYMSSSKTGK